MNTLPWNRRARIAEVRDQIWSYVTPSSRFEVPGLLVAAGLLGWPEADARKLGELQFLLSDEVGAFVEVLPQLVRRLATTSAREEEYSSERIHGPIQWSRTLALRAASGSPGLYVTAPARRVHQTPENELLVYVLDAVVDLARSSGWDTSLTRQRPAALVHDRAAAAERWRQSRMLSSIQRIPPSPRSLARIRSGRTKVRYGPVLDAYNKLVSLVERLDREAIRAAVEQAGLVIADEGRLFELLTTFAIVDALRMSGWPLQPFHLVEGKIRSRGRRADGRTIQLWYQSSPRQFIVASRYRHILQQHAFSNQLPLRPDLILQWKDQQGAVRHLMVECKLSQARGVGHAARQALVDLLAYRRAFGSALGSVAGPYGLGVAWGEELEPNQKSEIILCTPDTLKQVVSSVVT